MDHSKKRHFRARKFASKNQYRGRRRKPKRKADVEECESLAARPNQGSGDTAVCGNFNEIDAAIKFISASEKKIEQFESERTKSVGGSVSRAVCPTCHTAGLVVRDTASKRKGLSLFLELYCDNSECPESVVSAAHSSRSVVPEGQPIDAGEDWSYRSGCLRDSFAVNVKTSFRGRRAVHPELEDKVADFVRAHRARSLPVTSELIRIKAIELARESGLTREQFKGSIYWVRRFMRRKGFALRRRTSICQKLPEAYEDKLVEFQRYVIRLRQQHGYMLGQIGNADETPVWFDMPSSTTVCERGAKEVKLLSTGNEHSRFTVMLACTADGRKLPPFIIFKRKTLPRETFPRDVVVRVNEKGYMDEALMVNWIQTVWNRRPGALLRSSEKQSSSDESADSSNE
ncbi:hypothetical protein MTO96_043812 [Rhipicephalus appendiculatus]